MVCKIAATHNLKTFNSYLLLIIHSNYIIQLFFNLKIEKIDTMIEDLKTFIELEVDGLVFGALTSDGRVDTAVMKQFLVHIPSHTKKTFHRAFDVGSDWTRNLTSIIELGFDSLLTSGCAANAYEGRTRIAQLVELRDSLTNGRSHSQQLKVIAGAGVTSANLATILRETNCDEFHASCRVSFQSEMSFKNEQISMGSPLLNEFETKHTGQTLVKQLADIYSCFRQQQKQQHP